MDAKGINRCLQYAQTPVLSVEKRERCFYTLYGKVANVLIHVICKCCGCIFYPFVGFFSEKRKCYFGDLLQSLVFSDLNVHSHETSRRTEGEVGIKVAVI